MKVLKAREAIQRRELREDLEKKLQAEWRRVHQKECDRLNREQEELEKYNVLLHILHFFCILHAENGYGKVKLNRLLDAWQKYAPKLKQDLDDGVAWTTTIKELEQIGVRLEYDRDLIERHQRRYSRGIKYGEESETNDEV